MLAYILDNIIVIAVFVVVFGIILLIHKLFPNFRLGTFDDLEKNKNPFNDDDDRRNNPAYSHLMGNIHYQTHKRRNRE